MEEFEEQLRLEKLADQKTDNNEIRTRTDSDGTVYEWDSEKKAWFPKVKHSFSSHQSCDKENIFVCR